MDIHTTVKSLVELLYERCPHGGENVLKWQCVQCRESLLINTLLSIQQQALRVACIACRKFLSIRGAVLLSPPDHFLVKPACDRPHDDHDHIVKNHLCTECYTTIWQTIEKIRSLSVPIEKSSDLPQLSNVKK
mgnify:CR=1 FL=1